MRSSDPGAGFLAGIAARRDRTILPRGGSPAGPACGGVLPPRFLS
jgi:hypothetical protein